MHICRKSLQKSLSYIIQVRRVYCCTMAFMVNNNYTLLLFFVIVFVVLVAVCSGLWCWLVHSKYAFALRFSKVLSAERRKHLMYGSGKKGLHIWSCSRRIGDSLPSYFQCRYSAISTSHLAPSSFNIGIPRLMGLILMASISSSSWTCSNTFPEYHSWNLFLKKSWWACSQRYLVVAGDL